MNNGLDETKIEFSDNALLDVIRYFTRESGATANRQLLRHTHLRI